MRFNTQAFRARLAFNTVGVSNSSSSFAKPSGSNIKELSSYVSSSSTKLQRFFSKVSVPRNERLAAFDSSISNTEHSSLPNRYVSKQSRLFSTVESLDVKGGVETKPVVEKETSSSEPKKREGGYKSSEPKFQNELERLLFVAGSNSKYSFFLPKLGLETSADLLQYVEKALGAASKQERTRFYQKALDTMASQSGVHFPLSNMMVHLLSTEYAENQLAAAELYDLVSSRQLFYSLGRKTFKVTKGLLLNEYIKTNKREELVQKFFKDCEASSAGDVGKLLIESERGVHYLVSLVHFAEPKDQVKLIELILGNIVGAAKNETFRMTLLELVKDVKSNPSSALKPVIDKVFDSMQQKAVELVSTREGLDFTLKFFENGSPERLTTFLPVILPQLEQLCLEPKSRGLILFLLKNLEVPQKVELINALGEHLDCLSEGFGGVSIVIEILTQTKTHNICPDVSMKASDFVLKKSENKASGSGGVALAKVIESGSEEGKERAMKFIKSDRFGSRAQDASAIQAALLSTDENTRLDVLQKLVAQLDEITTETQFHFKLDTILKDRAICDTFVTLPDGTSQKFIDIVFQKYAGDAAKFIGYSRGQFSSYIIEQLIKQADNAQIAQFRGYIFGSREVPKDQNYTVLKQLFDFHSGPYIVKHLLKRDVNNLNRQADLAVLAEIFGDVCMKPDSAQFYEDILDTTIYAPEEYMNKVFVPRVLENYAKLMETPGEAPQKYLVKHALHFKYLKHADKIELMKIVRKKNLLPQMLNDPHPWGQFALLNMVRPPGSLRYDAARERSFFAEVLGLGKSIADFMVDKAKSGDKTPIPSAFADRVIGTEERAKRLYQDLCGYNPREINNEILTHWEKYDDMFGDKDIEEVLVILYDNCTESKQAEFKTKYEGKVAIW